jgi:hypothetical protein
VTCKKCGMVLLDRSRTTPGLGKRVPPPDWTFLQIGSGGTYHEDPFLIIGRVRLQLKNEYKNIWTCYFKSGKATLLVESFGALAMLHPEWIPYTGDITMLRAAKRIPIAQFDKLEGEFLEKCFDVTYEGETGIWKFFRPDFFLVQCGDRNGKYVLIPFYPRNKVEYLAGEKVTLEKLQLTNIVTWDEWR